MKDANAEFQKFSRAWATLRQAREAEIELSSAGLKGAKASDFDSLFSEWEGLLGTAAARTKAVSPDDHALEAVITHLLAELGGWVVSAVGNGFAWLFQSSPFIERVAEIHGALHPIIGRRLLLRRALVEAAKQDLSAAISRVEEVAPIAERVVELQGQIEAKSSSADEALSELRRIKAEYISDAAQASANLKDIARLAAEVTASKATYDKVILDSDKVLAEARTALDEVNAAKARSDQAIESGAEAVEIATKKLTKSIADVNRQGLAGSFQASVKRLQLERAGWLVAFVVSIVYLVLVAGGVIGPASSPKSESTTTAKVGQNTVVPRSASPRQPSPTNSSSLEQLEKLLRLLPFLAPGIWLGWFAAKNASMTARIEQDYAYKVATAQGFEAYKKEAALHEDEALSSQLLATAIHNFGDNPIRLYDGKAPEGHPMEELRSVFADKNSFDRFVRLLEALRPSAK